MTLTDLDDVALRARLDELHPIINAAGAPRESVLEYEALEDEFLRRIDRDDVLVIGCDSDVDPADDEDDSRHLDEDQGQPSEWGA